MKSDKVLLIRHRVAKYKKWRDIFEAHGPTRKAHGCQGGRLFRSVDNPSELVILLSWNDPEKARQFAASDDLREMMARAGVSDMPDVYLLQELGTITAD
jgi:quinol monooxygenase YgiN